MFKLYENQSVLRAGGVYDTLTDEISLQVTEQRNGAFDLVLQYPMDGWKADNILPNAIIMAEPSHGASEEPFWIYEIEKTIDGLITARAHHLVYLSDGIECDLANTGISAIISFLNMNYGAMRGYLLVNNGITDESTVVNIDKKSLWSIIGTLASTFNAELSYHYNPTTHQVEITFNAARGTQKNTVIKYGVNIVSLDYKQSAANMYSAVRAWWWDGASQSSVVSGIVSTGITSITRILSLDCSKAFQTKPTVAQLEAVATDYIAQNGLSSIQNELTVDFVPLEITTENIASEQMNLCDTATVDATLIGVTATAKCVETIYNVMTKKYESVKVGILQPTIIDTIASVQPSGVTSSEWKPSTGAVISDAQASSLLVSGSFKQKASVTLPAGTWHVNFGTSFAQNQTGRREVILSASADSGTAYIRGSGATANAVTGDVTILNADAVIVLTSSTTLYMNAYQNSGSSITVYPWIRAVKII